MSHTLRDKNKLLNRVHRIQGQLNTLETQLAAEGDCYRMLQLATACRGAINSLIFEIIEGHIRFHIINPDENPTDEQSVATQQLIDVIKSYFR